MPPLPDPARAGGTIEVPDPADARAVGEGVPQAADLRAGTRVPRPSSTTTPSPTRNRSYSHFLP
ncbi:hypothetical protein [Streptomyces sp. NPDC003480]